MPLLNLRLTALTKEAEYSYWIHGASDRNSELKTDSQTKDRALNVLTPANNPRMTNGKLFILEGPVIIE